MKLKSAASIDCTLSHDVVHFFSTVYILYAALDLIHDEVLQGSADLDIAIGRLNSYKNIVLKQFLVLPNEI